MRELIEAADSEKLRKSAERLHFRRPCRSAADFDDLLIRRERVDRAGRGTARSFLSGYPDTEAPPASIHADTHSLLQRKHTMNPSGA